jgi:hypothetical protein
LTTEEKIKQLRSQLSILKKGQLVNIAAQDTHVMMLQRIFDEGKNASDVQIGNYNTTNELYVNPNKAPKKFPTKGKPNEKGIAKSKFQNGKPHKTGYFKSYSDFRVRVGRPVDKVNLVLFGDLNSDFGKAVTEISPLKYASTIRQSNEGKIKGADARYGNVFRLTPKERTNFKQVLAFETFRLLKGNA